MPEVAASTEAQDLSVFPATEAEFYQALESMSLSEPFPGIEAWYSAKRLLASRALTYAQVSELGIGKMAQVEALLGFGGALGIVKGALGDVTEIRSLTLAELTRILREKGLKIVPDVPGSSAAEEK